MNFFSMKRGGGRKGFSHAEGAGDKSFGIVFMQ